MNRFSIGISWRIALIVLSAWAVGYLWLDRQQPFLTLPLFIALISTYVSLYRYVTGMNRKLTRFLESVQYSDFAVSFKADDKLGESFQALNQQFNEVLEAFRQARAENEANLHYLNTIVQHVSVGLLTFDAAGKVELVNPAALRLLEVYRLRQLSDLQQLHPQLLNILHSTETSAPVMYQMTNGSEVSVRCANVRLRGRLVTVVSLQNIRTELQRRELDAWQNLTKVLRHEIMNSLTPVVSLTGTMRDILDNDLAPHVHAMEAVNAEAEDNGGYKVSDAVSDLGDALITIENRGRNLMRFVEAYRHFTTIPQPQFADVQVVDVFRHIGQLVQADIQPKGVKLTITPPSANMVIRADAGQIEMVLINLLRNAVESLDNRPNPQIDVNAVMEGPRIHLNVRDNGPGIEPEALEQIFIPFYTTKKTGSGIGLSLSRQIMQLHGGQLTVESKPGDGSLFTLIF